MKILTINCVYKKGSTGQIIEVISDCLEARNCEFVFCYECGDKAKEKNAFRIALRYEHLFYYVLARLTGIKYGTGYTSTLKLLRIIKIKTPDIVHIHCPNVHTVNIYWLVNYLKKNNIPTVITNHAEFFYTGNCPHAYDCEKFKTGCGNCSFSFDAVRPFRFDRTAYEWKKMKQCFNSFKNVTMIAVSSWGEDRLKQSPITSSLKTCVINNGIDTTNVFKPSGYKELKNSLNIKEDELVLLHVSASFTDKEEDLKGGKYVIQVATNLLKKKIKVVVVGPIHLKEDTKIPDNMILVGPIRDQKVLAQYYSMADLTVIASRRETYGMVCSESLACGTPIVGFKAGGPETISLKEFSEFVNYPDVLALKDCVERWIVKKNRLKDISIKAREAYSSEKMAEEYYRVYKNILRKRT